MDVTLELADEIYTEDIVNEYIKKAVPIIELIKTSIKEKQFMAKQQLILKDKRPLLERIREYINMLDAQLGVDQALLYGSTARSKRHRNSDVDIIIVSESFAKMPEPRRWVCCNTCGSTKKTSKHLHTHQRNLP
jgi:predicted nucleotidyltransferase